MGYSRLALTDTDNLYGLFPFLAACGREGVAPIVGAEITDPDTGSRAVCLVESMEGYRNLCELISRRHLGDDDPFFSGSRKQGEASENNGVFRNRTDGRFGKSVGPEKKREESQGARNSVFDILPRLSKGLSVLVRDPALLERLFEAGVYVAAAMPRRPFHAEHSLRRVARRLGVPLVAVPGSFFLRPEDHEAHRYLRAIDRNTSLSRLRITDAAPPDAWFAPPEEYRRRFSICPEALRATEELAERLAFSGPDFGLVMPPWEGEDGRTADRVLREAVYEGARGCYGDELSEPVVDRIEHELKTISRMGFSSYFLVVRDIVKASPRTCGRGSGAASLAAYCLGITNVCPVKHNLYFERFLNPGRKDPPDIDVDFAWDERDGVLKMVLEKYRGHAAMVCNHVTFKPRMAIRETAKVFGLADAEIGAVSKKLPWFWPKSDSEKELFERLKGLPRLKNLDFQEPWPEIIAVAQRIMGVPRYLSVHPGGVVIAPRPIYEYVPVERAAKGVPIIQWEKDAAEDAGLVKIDLLGNRSLGVIRDAVAAVKEGGRDFREEGWEPEDDFVTQEALAQGRTMGCFYIESPAMRLLQQKSGVGDFEHLVIHSSIIRPAANDFIREYIRRLHGGEWNPIHPFLTDVLDETFGIMVYQEDVSKVAVSLAGFSHAEADGLRKIMSKKDRERHLRDYYGRFAEGARKRGVTDDQIAAIWDMMMSFGGYSFCKPHSASYARVSFQAAYLKAHFPAEFMAAVISNQGGFYGTFAYVSESRRLGLEILPPDANLGRTRWTGRDGAIRVGFLSVKGLSGKTRDRIFRERERSPFADLCDFLERVRPEDPEARALIHCGALDRFHPEKNRAALLWEFSAWRNADGKNCSARSLFAGRRADFAPPPALPPEDQRARLRREFAVLGFLCDRHPMELFEDALEGLGVVKVRDIPRHVGRRIRFAGWLITGRTVRTKHGDPMEFLTFEDDTGVVETTFFPDAYKRFCHMIDRGRPYVLTGVVDQDWGATTLTVEKVNLLHSSPLCIPSGFLNGRSVQAFPQQATNFMME